MFLLVNNSLLYFILNRKTIFLFFLLRFITTFSQIDTSQVIIFDFNDHLIKEKENKLIPKPIGVSLVEDRFGNEESAIYLHGQRLSYLNLGVSNLLKPKTGTVSLWVKLERKVYAGKGYESNPIIVTKNSKNPDFCDAYIIFYDFKSDRLMCFSSKDSTEQSGVNSLETIVFNKWYHLVFRYDNSHLSFFINGQLQLETQKRFETVFDSEDSVVVGHGASIKNDRYMRGTVDDIQIYHRLLSDKEVKELYEAPNPNEFRNAITEVGKYILLVFIFLVVLFFIVYLNKRKLKRQKEYYELKNKINELEIKVIKGQINPHFISNCLAAIQNLILQNQSDIAARYIAKFNRLMRSVLNVSDRTFIYLSEEIEIIKLNIELEQLRFKNIFEFKLSINENVDCEGILVPSLITQPIIENSIWHGLLPLKGKRIPILNMNVFIENEFIIIEVIDNGVGRFVNKENTHSKGTKLVYDKLQSVNKLSSSINNKLTIVDLYDTENNAIGTKVRFQLEQKYE